MRVTSLLEDTRAGYTITVGVLLGFRGGYYDSFKQRNPALRSALTRELSLCGRPATHQASDAAQR